MMDLKDIFNENHNLDIPQSVFDNEIKAYVQKIINKPGFNPITKFDPAKHLKYTGSGKKHSFESLGITKTHVKPINQIAAVEPFQMFTAEAIDMMNYEIFSNTQLLKKYGRLNQANNSKNASILDFHISGFIDDTEFTKAAWCSPELKAIFNEVMEDKLIMAHRFTMSHINVSLADSSKPELEPGIDYLKLKEEQDKNDEIDAGVNWHYDSPPLVCVCMLSAPDNMIGGETGIRLGDESVLRIPGPKVGYGTMLQGRVIKHIATKPLNNVDRISYVVSFIPEDVNRYDSTCATSERPSVSTAYTNDRFYPTFLSYRFERVEKRLKQYREMLTENYAQDKKFDQMDAIKFIKDIETYLKVSYDDFEVLGEKTYPPPLFKTPYSEL